MPLTPEQEPLEMRLQRLTMERDTLQYKLETLSINRNHLEEAAALEMYAICWRYFRVRSMPSREMAMRVWKLRREVKT